MQFHAHNYYLPNCQQTKDGRATDSCFALTGCIRVEEYIQLIVDAGLLLPSIILNLFISYPPEVKLLEFAKGIWRLSGNVCCVLFKCGALVSMALWCPLGRLITE